MHKYLPAFLIMGALSAQAEVNIFNVFLSGNGTGGAPAFYAIPAGNVYVIEGVVLVHSGGDTPTNTEIRVGVSADNLVSSSFMSIPVSDTYNESKLTMLTKPFRLKAGEELHVPNNIGTTNYFIVRYFGLMMDEVDLYAQAIPSELLDVDVVGGQLMARAQFGSPRPRITTIESAVQVSSFTEDATGVEIASVNRNQADVAVNTSGANQKFLRVSAVARD